MRRIRPGYRQPAAEFFVVEAFELWAQAPVPVQDHSLNQQQGTAAPVERRAHWERAADFELLSADFVELAAAGR